MTQPRSTVAWDEVHRLLDARRLATEAGTEGSAEAVSRVLADRARRLAQPLEDYAPVRTRDLLVFLLAGGRYGLDTTQALEAMALRELVTVPSTPAFVLGIVNHRGRVLPVLDLRPVLGATGGEPIENGWVLVVKAAGMEFGLAVESIVGMEREDGDMNESPTTARHAFIRGVTSNMVAVLNLEILMRDPRMVVDQETP